MNKLKGCLWVVVIILLTTISPLAYGSSNFSAEDGNKIVSSVDVRLEFPEKKEIYSDIEERIANSIQKVARTILAGQKVSLIKQNRNEITHVMKAVFDKVLWGYQVTDIDLIVGEKTYILVELAPTSILIEKVKVDLQIQGVNDKIVEVVNEELEMVSNEITEVMLGLPVDSLHWSSDVIKPILYHLVKWQLPGFEPTIDLGIGKEITVDLKLVPTGELIKDIQIDIVTQSLPRIFSNALEKRIELELKIFEGLPVALLDKYQDKVIEIVDQAIYNNGRNEFVYLNDRPQMDVGSVTNLTIDVDWIDYKMEFLGEVSVGVNAPGPALYLSLGKRLGTDTVLQLQNKITLDRLLGTVSIDLEHNFGANFVANVGYNLNDSKINARLDWRKGKFGATLNQTYPGDFRDSRISINYYLRPYTKLSLTHQNKNIWLSIQQSL